MSRTSESQRQRAEAAILHTLLLQQEPWHSGNWLIYMLQDQPFDCGVAAARDALDHLVDTQVLTMKKPGYPSSDYWESTYAIVKLLPNDEVKGK